jgi:protein phosphatase
MRFGRGLLAHGPNGAKLALCPTFAYALYDYYYRLPENLPRLRARNVRGKRNLALREFALGLEGLERFIANAPLRDVHRCVFGVLALESEVLDPRL